MVKTTPHRHVVPESSRERAERLLPQLKQIPVGERSLGDGMEVLAARIRAAETPDSCWSEFYRLAKRTDVVLKEILELAMIGNPEAPPTPHCQQQREKLSASMNQVLQAWHGWSQQWEATLVGDPNLRFTLEAARDDLPEALFRHARAIVAADRLVDASFGKSQGV